MVTTFELATYRMWIGGLCFGGDPRVPAFGSRFLVLLLVSITAAVARPIVATIVGVGVGAAAVTTAATAALTTAT